MIDLFWFTIAGYVILALYVWRKQARHRMFNVCRLWVEACKDPNECLGSLCASYHLLYGGGKIPWWVTIWTRPTWYLYPNYRDRHIVRAYWWGRTR